jgi:hypothetical protein
MYQARRDDTARKRDLFSEINGLYSLAGSVEGTGVQLKVMAIGSSRDERERTKNGTRDRS